VCILSLGWRRNHRLIAEIKDELAAAEKTSLRTGKRARRFKQFKWTTRRSWSRERRVVPKAEWTQGEANPRFIVTSLRRTEWVPRRPARASPRHNALWQPSRASI
jgi:Transposase DDE domain group 1